MNIAVLNETGDGESRVALMPESVQKLIEGRMQEMSYPDLVELLRSAMKEDEWLLLLHGAVLGFVAGLIHLGLFG